MTNDIHTLLELALLIPFVSLGLALLALIFGLAWKGSK
jgi:hypothetical protein